MVSDDSSRKRRKKRAKNFKIWPVPKKPDIPYGPRPKQALLFIEDLPEEDTWVYADDWNPADPENPINGKEMINIKRPHKHPLDIILFIGGARSGKTLSASARLLDFMLRYKKSTCVVGAENYPLLQRTAMKEVENRFTSVVPWDMMKMDDPIILKKPNPPDKKLVLYNGSQAYFIHFNDPEVLRGIDADFIWFEEACLLPDESAFDELQRRLSGTRAPIRQLILTTNPEGKGGWITEKFKLRQLKADYTGVIEPIVDPCKCHLCQICLNNKFGDAPEYIDDICPKCGAKKENDCPGNQEYVRVIRTLMTDNPHIPQDLSHSLKGTMDAKTYRVFVEGSTEDLHDGEVYKAFDEDNIFRVPEPVSYEKDLIWTMDFNFEPQCSAVCQEEETSAGFRIKVLDEIVLWNALPEHAAQEFCDRYKDWNLASQRCVLIYGDPAGLYSTGDGLKPSTYQIIYDVLKRNGFDARIMMKKPDPDAYIKEPVKIPVAGRVDAMNAMLRSADDPPQIRMMINPQCRNLIRSLRELRWAEDGMHIDKNVDKRAARSVDKDKPMCMTHPTDALGYYVYKRFPVLKAKRGISLFQVPGLGAVSYQDGVITQVDRRDKSSRINEEREKKREERRKKLEEKQKSQTNSIANSLRQSGCWPGQGPNLWFF